MPDVLVGIELGMSDSKTPKKMWGMSKAPKKYVAFNSSVGITRADGKERKTPAVRVLSNFCEVPGGIKWRGKLYPSAEHLYQMLLKADPSCWAMFECGGVLGSVESGFRTFGFKDDALKKKVKFWGPIKSSGRPAMVGIVAKMAINDPKRVKGLKLKPKPESGFTDQELIDIFLPILKAKYRDFKAFRDVLKSVPKDTTLVEFSRSAEREVNAYRSPRWTGLVKGDYLFGQNLCGRIMTMLRDEMCE